MSEALGLVLAWMAGGVLGLVFFGGLWWTIQKGLSSKHPTRWFLGSLLLRMGIVITGLYLVGRGGHWERLLLCLLGFIMARVLVMRLTRPPQTKLQSNPQQESAHAPQSR
jgi:F1F0 ATPase subunit 2